MKSVFISPAGGRRAAAGTAVALVAATLSLGLAGPASAANTTELEGTVTGLGGAPLAGIEVQPFDAATGQPLQDATSSYWPSAVTDATGHYQFDDLGTASVKLRFYDTSALSMTSALPYTPRWLAGATNFGAATTLPVTEDPATPVTAQTLSLSERYGAVSGTLTADGRPASDPNLSVQLSAYNADDDWAAGGYVTAGSSYRMLIVPGVVRTSAEAIDTSTDPANPIYFIRKWWQNTYSQANATPITVGSGQSVGGIDFALTRSLVATRAPQVVGFPTVGRALSAAPGTWSQMADTGFSYTWLRGTTVVGTGPTYVPTRSDFGSRLTLKVVAGADKYGWFHNTGQASVTSAVVRYPANEHLSHKALAGHRVAVHVRMVAAKQSPVRGRMVVLRNGHVIKSGLKLVHGKVAFVLRHQPKGHQTYTVRYQGNRKLAKIQKTFNVRVHK